MCVLVVDDSPIAQFSLQRLLETHGYSPILTAASGREALQRLEAEFGPDGRCRVEVVLLDVAMPDMDGIETCRRIRANAHLTDIPILVMTGGTDEDLLLRAFEAGAVDFLAKPLQPAELLARLRSALKRKRELDRCKEQKRQLEEVSRQLRHVNEELTRLAVRDELTAIGNRRFFNLLLDQEWGRAARDVLPLSLLLMDVDWFKAYNDRYGHPRGDECLRQVAGRAQALLQRSGDYVARFGGEEFAVLLPHTATRGAVRVAERIRHEVAELALEHLDSPSFRYVTVSVGVATVIPERRVGPDALVSAADVALYQAKREGRNRVSVHPGPLSLAAVTSGDPSDVTTN